MLMKNKTISHTGMQILFQVFLSFVIAAVLVLFADYGMFISAYKLSQGKLDGIITTSSYTQQVKNASGGTIGLYIWRSVYTILPIWLSAFWILMFGISLKRDSKEYTSKIKNGRLLWLISILRYITGFAGAWVILNYNRMFWDDTFHNCLLGRGLDFVRVICAGLFFSLIVTNWKKAWPSVKNLNKSHAVFAKILLTVIVSIIICCLLEFQCASKMEMITYMLIFNVLYWFIIQGIFLLFFRNPKPGAIFALIFSWMIGLANDVVYQFRGNYIMFGDLTVIRTAVEVAGNYTYHPTFWFWLCLALLIVSVVAVLLVHFPKRIKGKVSCRIISTVIGEALIVAAIVITFHNGMLYNNVFGVGWNYNDNVAHVGYLPYFLSNMNSTQKVIVEGYTSAKADDAITSELSSSGNENSSVTSVATEEPNIIVIQNEAFSDLAVTADIQTDQDYMPFVRSLKKNTIKGYMNMSITGGPTSDTEFEVLSRTSLAFFPYGSVPYTQYLKQNIPSFPVALQNEPVPYNTSAYHSYYSSGYNRESVYDFLGFQSKYFENNYLNDFPSSYLVREYLSDETDYAKVKELYEQNKLSGNPFFCFNVTIQNHGGYTGSNYKFSDPVNVTNFDATASINTYLSLIKMSDDAFKNLVDYFSKQNDPTIIVMYGDHQPGWDDEAKNELAAHPAYDDENLETLSAYYVPYVIWANYDIGEKDDMGNGGTSGTFNKISTNYLASYVMQIAGLKLSDYDRYLLDIHEKVPALTAIGCWTSDGTYYSSASNSPYADVLSGLEMVQYNMIFDKNNKITSRFLPEN